MKQVTTTTTAKRIDWYIQCSSNARLLTSRDTWTVDTDRAQKFTAKEAAQKRINSLGLLHVTPIAIQSSADYDGIAKELAKRPKHSLAYILDHIDGRNNPYMICCNYAKTTLIKLLNARRTDWWRLRELQTYKKFFTA